MFCFTKKAGKHRSTKVLNLLRSAVERQIPPVLSFVRKQDVYRLKLKFSSTGSYWRPSKEYGRKSNKAKTLQSDLWAAGHAFVGEDELCETDSELERALKNLVQKAGPFLEVFSHHKFKLLHE